MGRIIKEIRIEGKPGIALFDTGSIHTYIRSRSWWMSPRDLLAKPYRVALGGKEIEVRELCVALGEIEGMEFDAEAVPIDQIGRADGHELDAIIGALTMEKWEIRLDPKKQELDLEGLRRREFTEFLKQWKTVHVRRPDLARLPVHGAGRCRPGALLPRLLCAGFRTPWSGTWRRSSAGCGSRPASSAAI